MTLDEAIEHVREHIDQYEAHVLGADEFYPKDVTALKILLEAVQEEWRARDAMNRLKSLYDFAVEVGSRKYTDEQQARDYQMDAGGREAAYSIAMDILSGVFSIPKPKGKT